MSAQSSLQRVLTTLGHREPDRVPLFLLLTLHGAKELGLSIRDYFSRPDWVAEGQKRLQRKYQNDCFYGLYYAPIEIEAWGGEVLFCEDGPPNSGNPFLRDSAAIMRLEPPRIADSPCLQRVLETIRLLQEEGRDQVPVIGVVMSPFSLPVMQLGFDTYLDLMHGDPVRFDRLMAVNEEFCVAWANAQLAAGATAIVYFDPVSSSTIIPPERYRISGKEIARRTIARIHGPVGTHFASGRCLPILADVMETGTALVGISAEESVVALKAATRGRLGLVGNLNGIEMRRWSPEQAEQTVRALIRQAAPGGGFILSDNHGEIPFQVPDTVLAAIADATRKWGEYPIKNGV